MLYLAGECCRTPFFAALIDLFRFSPALNLAYAEQQELMKNHDEVRSTYDKLLKLMAEELDAVEARIASETATTPISSNPHSGLGAGVDASGGETDSKDDNSGATNGDSDTKEVGFAPAQKSDEKVAQPQELKDKCQEYGAIYINYIRFALRSEGVEASRQVFAKARKDKWTPWTVFDAAGETVLSKIRF